MVIPILSSEQAYADSTIFVFIRYRFAIISDKNIPLAILATQQAREQ